MKNSTIIFLSLACLMTQIFSINYYNSYNYYNPYRSNNDQWLEKYGVTPRYQRYGGYDDLTYRGYNTYNFNNYVPLRYGLFPEAETNQFIRNSIDYYKRNNSNQGDSNQVRKYKKRFNNRNPITYQDWYGLSRYYPSGYNSYRVF